MDEHMVSSETDTPDENAELAALADGSLSAERRRALEDRVTRSPRLAALLAEQQLATSLVRGLDVTAPAALRARIQDMTRTAKPPRRLPALRPRFALAAATAAAALVVALAIALPGGTGGPTVVQAAALAERPATLPAPAQSGRLLAMSESGVSYPNWEYAFAWRAAGARTDTIGGRHATTVFYVRGGRRIAYSIVSGQPLAANGHWTPLTRSGVSLRVLRQGPTTIVTWERGGHSCIIAARGVPSAELEALAAWRNNGSALRA